MSCNMNYFADNSTAVAFSEIDFCYTTGLSPNFGLFGFTIAQAENIMTSATMLSIAVAIAILFSFYVKMSPSPPCKASYSTFGTTARKKAEVDYLRRKLVAWTRLAPRLARMRQLDIRRKDCSTNSLINKYRNMARPKSNSPKVQKRLYSLYTTEGRAK